MTEARLIGAIRAATEVMRRATIEMRLEVAMDRFQRLLRERSLERRYNPDWRSQPRVPRGDRDGGQWTRGRGGVGGEDGGSVPSDAVASEGQRPARRTPPQRSPSGTPVGLTDPRVISDATPTNDWELGERYSQVRPPRGGGRGGSRVTINGRPFEMNLEQATRLDTVSMQRDVAVSRLRQVEPNWRPNESIYETVEGLISATREEMYEANARYLELQNAGVCPGPFAGESIPARSSDRDFRSWERSVINGLGSELGCHTCGVLDPGTVSGNFVPDHQLPNVLNPTGRPQRLFPQCLNCSNVQGGWSRYLKSRRQ